MNFGDIYRELEKLYEAKRVISDVDALYHYTNPTPLFKIFTENCLRADVHCEAVCLTTDRDYIIYDYPVGMKLSRKKLTNAGYELVKFDEYEDDIDARGESEERVYENIDNLSNFVSVVFVDWNKITIVHSAEGDRIADAAYDEEGETESYDLMLADFKALLNKIRAKGIAVKETGKQMSGEYWLGADGKLVYADDYEDSLAEIS